MRCFQIDAPGRFSYSDRPEPRLEPGEVLLRIRKLGFCGSDLSSFRGANPLVSYPRVPGHEIAAEILAVSEGVPPEFSPGRLTTVLPYTSCGNCSACRSARFNACRHNRTLGVQQDGALTDRITQPWKKLMLAPGLGLRELALVEPLAVGFHAVDRGRVSASDWVAVFGCGMVGLGAIAAAALQRGARVIAVDLEDSKAGVALKAGAAHFVNARTENLHERLLELTGGHGPDVAIEAAGSPASFTAAVGEVCFAGRVVYIGYAKTPVSYETKLFVQKELDVLGSRNATRGDFEAVVSLLGSGTYPAEETVTRTVQFAEAGEALAQWSANPGAITKIQVEL